MRSRRTRSRSGAGERGGAGGGQKKKTPHSRPRSVARELIPVTFQPARVKPS